MRSAGRLAYHVAFFLALSEEDQTWVGRCDAQVAERIRLAKSENGKRNATALHAEKDADGRSVHGKKWADALHAERDADGKSVHAKKSHAKRDLAEMVEQLKRRHVERDPDDGKSVFGKKTGAKARETMLRNGTRPSVSLTDDEAREVHVLFAAGVFPTEIQRRLPQTSTACIYDILHGRTYKHLRDGDGNPFPPVSIAEARAKERLTRRQRAQARKRVSGIEGWETRRRLGSVTSSLPKFCDGEIREIRRMLSDGASTADVRSKFPKASGTNIAAIRKGTTYRGVK